MKQNIKTNTTMVIACGAMMVFISMGTRQSFGLFLQPITSDLAVGRETFSLAIAWQNILFGLPLIGILADRFGSRKIAIGGGLLYAASFLLLSATGSPAGLYLNLGVLAGSAIGCTSYVVVLGAAARVVPPDKRSSMFGIITAAGSFGMFAVVPGVQWLIASAGWQTSFATLAAFVGLTAILAIGFSGRPDGSACNPSSATAEIPQTLTRVLGRARRHSGYLFLTAGFFVCGFHVAFIATHLPAFLADNSVSKMTAATALAMIGLFNIFGSYLFGYLGDRFRKKYLLSFLYLSRAIVITLFLVLPISNFSAIFFGCAIGFLWLATVPLTSGIVAQIFGARYLSTLYGIVFFSHQIGSFLGVWLGGRVYDISNSYGIVWVMAILLGVTAAILHLPITDQPVKNPTVLEASKVKS
ncbi:MAG: MFS transporter [Desulfobacterales bacterium]|nr:MAG: MFS transporter [Desulfobacterales bacterium]